MNRLAAIYLRISTREQSTERQPRPASWRLPPSL